jgi:hypothetical protein
MPTRSFYCRKCQVLVDVSEVDSPRDGVYFHTLIRALTGRGEVKSITHEVIAEG